MNEMGTLQLGPADCKAAVLTTSIFLLFPTAPMLSLIQWLWASHFICGASISSYRN